MRKSESGKPVCKYCGDSGRELNDAGFAVPCRNGCLERIRSSRAKMFSSVPKKFEDSKVSNFDPSVYRNKQSVILAVDALKKVQFWVKNLDEDLYDGTGLYLYSAEKGSGKTRMAASIVNDLMSEHQIKSKFATSLEILNTIKATYDENSELHISEYGFIDRLKTAQVLAIDDFGMERANEWSSEKFFDIINYRYINKLITIYTSNFSPYDLKYDERIKDRIMENSIVIHFPEESVRTKSAEIKVFSSVL